MDDIEIGNAADEEGDSADPLARLAKLKEKLKHCEKEKAEYLDGWQRAKADSINFKKDEARRLQAWRETLENAILVGFLPVLESFDLSLSAAAGEHISTDAKRGLDLIRSQFLDALRRFSVSEIETAGAVFNPAVHEAIEEVESDKESGSIVEVLQRGFERNGKVLQPAKVKVARNKLDH